MSNFINEIFLDLERKKMLNNIINSNLYSHIEYTLQYFCQRNVNDLIINFCLIERVKNYKLDGLSIKKEHNFQILYNMQLTEKIGLIDLSLDTILKGKSLRDMIYDYYKSEKIKSINLKGPIIKILVDVF